MLDPPGVAALAQHVVVQRVAAAALLLAAQQHAAVHAPAQPRQQVNIFFIYQIFSGSPVAVHVEAAVERHDPDCLVLAGRGHDGLAAHRAPRGEPPVEILNTGHELGNQQIVLRD